MDGGTSKGIKFLFARKGKDDRNALKLRRDHISCLVPVFKNVYTVGLHFFVGGFVRFESASGCLYQFVIVQSVFRCDCLSKDQVAV